MSTYSRRGVHGQFVDALGLRILSGDFVPGTVVDPEMLIAEYDVSRTVVRESLKVLAAKGLVDARPRTGTYITERSRWQLLDIDVMSWRSRGATDPLLLLELGEVRQVIEPAAARMAAARRTDDHVLALRESLNRMIELDGEDPAALVSADLAFHRAVLLAAGNELLQRFEVILEPALQARNSMLHNHAADRDFLIAHGRVVDAIEEQDADLAQLLMSKMMTQAAADTEEAVARTDEGQSVLAGRIRTI